MVSTTMKAVIISTFIALFLYLPTALDFSLSESPIFWNSFISWLKPPYLFVVINVIITIIVASSSSSSHQEDEQEDTLYDEYKIIETNQQTELKNVDIEPDFDSSVTFQPIVVPEVLEVTNGGDETLEVLEVSNGGNETLKLNQVTEEPENLAPVGSGYQKPVLKGVSSKKKKVLMRVAKPKKTTSMEDTWKMVKEEGKSTALTVEVKKRALRKSVTFRDMTNYQRSEPEVKVKTEVSPSREELNRRVEAFIKKCKEERLIETMRV